MATRKKQIVKFEVKRADVGGGLTGQMGINFEVSQSEQLDTLIRMLQGVRSLADSWKINAAALTYLKALVAILEEEEQKSAETHSEETGQSSPQAPAGN